MPRRSINSVLRKLSCIVTADDHESAVFIEIGACRIDMAEFYAHAVEAVQGRTFTCSC